MAATVKGHITKFVNKGNNVTDAKEMEKTILSHGGLPGILVAEFVSEKLKSPDRNKKYLTSVS